MTRSAGERHGLALRHARGDFTDELGGECDDLLLVEALGFEVAIDRLGEDPHGIDLRLAVGSRLGHLILGTAFPGARVVPPRKPAELRSTRLESASIRTTDY